MSERPPTFRLKQVAKDEQIKTESLCRRFSLWFGALLFYLVIILLFSGSILADLPARLVGTGHDDLVFLWNAWWLSESLLSGDNPYFCSLQFAPTGVPLIFHALVLLPSLVIALLAKLTSPVMAYNTVALGLYPLAGLCAFSLNRYVTRDTVGGLVGGLVFMLCPFLISKSLGHLNLACAAFLPLYTMCLLRSVAEGGRQWRWALLGSYLLILFSNTHTTIFALNVTVWYFLYRGLRSGHWRNEWQTFWKTFKPVVWGSLIWGSVVFTYAVRYHLYPSRGTNRAFCPDPMSFVLPLHTNSLWQQYVAPAGELGVRLANLELAVYLGVLVFPLAAAGWWMTRHKPVMKFVVVLFIFALVLSFGHKLVWKREIVKVAGVTVYLPMGLYRLVPVLGSVVQHGRYMVIGYMALSVGVAGLVSAARRRFGNKRALPLCFAVAGLVCADYASRFFTAELPPCPIPPGPGRVMDPRLWTGAQMYYQTIHGRPLVGLGITRATKRWEKSYRAMPGIGWFFTKPEDRKSIPACEEVLDALNRLDIRYVSVHEGSPEQQLLETCGLEVVARDRWGVTLRTTRSQ